MTKEVDQKRQKNRQAQKAFRDRQQKKFSKLQQDNQEMEKEIKKLRAENQRLKDQNKELRDSQIQDLRNQRRDQNFYDQAQSHKDRREDIRGEEVAYPNDANQIFGPLKDFLKETPTDDFLTVPRTASLSPMLMYSLPDWGTDEIAANDSSKISKSFLNP